MGESIYRDMAGNETDFCINRFGIGPLRNVKVFSILASNSWTTPHIVDSEESKFDYEYLQEFDAKKEKASTVL
jgi:hypothetical protein